MPDHYTQLLEWRRAESAARGLSKLPHDFYAATRVYLGDARATFEREVRENPAGKKSELARQTYQRASQIARDVVEARMTKVVSFAFQAAVGGAKDVANLLAEERGLFDELTQVLAAHRSTVAPYLEGASGPTPTSLAGSHPAAGPVAAPQAPEGAPAPAPPVFVRILQDQRAIDTGTESIELRKDDVLSLPEKIARILVDSKVAERVGADVRRAMT
ncbi:MAG TPA: hypothetical protein VFF67_10510 [Thermoplasmata archaeon]|nr:hypothetical protein [Thermoplasmata archaeon]